MLSAAIPGHHTESPEFTRCFADFHCPGRKMFEKTNSPPTKLKRRRGIFIGWDLENLAGGVCNKRPFSKIESFVNFATTSRPPITLLLVGIFGLCLLSKLFSALRVNFGAFQSNVGGNIITWWMVAINFFDGGWLLMTTHIFRTSDDELRKI